LLEANNYVLHHYSLDKQASLPGAQPGFAKGGNLKIEIFLRRRFDDVFYTTKFDNISKRRHY